MLTLLLSFISLIVLIISGLGWSLFFTQRQEKTLGYLLSPLFGVMYLAIIGQNLNLLGFPLKEARPYFFAALILSYFPIVFIYISKNHRSPRKLQNLFYLYFSRELSLVLLFGFFAMVLGLAPILKSMNLTVFGGGTDGVGYIRFSEFLLNSSVIDMPLPSEGYPWYYWVYTALPIDFLQPVFVMAVLSSLMNVEAFALFNPMMAISGFLLTVSVYIVMRYCFRMNAKVSVLSSAIMSMQQYWLFPSYTTFLNQVSGLPFFILFTGLAYRSILRFYWKIAIAAAILAAGIISTYIIMMAMLVPALVLFSIAYMKWHRRYSPFKLAFVLLLIPPVFLNDFFIQYVSRGYWLATNSYPGLQLGPFFQSVLQYMAIFLNARSFLHKWSLWSVQGIFSLGWVTFMTGLLFFGVFSLPRKLKVFCGCIILTMLVLWARAIQSDYTYALWKLLTYSQPLVTGMLVFSAYKVISSFKLQFARITVSLVVVMFVFLTGLQGLRMASHTFYICPQSILMLNEIYKKVNKNENERIHILTRGLYVYDFFYIVTRLKNLPLSLDRHDRLYPMIYDHMQEKDRGYKKKYLLFRKSAYPEITGKVIYENSDLKLVLNNGRFESLYETEN